MKVVKGLKNKEDEILSDFQKENLFESIVRGKDVTESIKTSRGEFVVKFPRTRDIETVGKLTAYRLKGISVQSFEPQIYNLIQMVAFLDVVTVSGPAWYENAKKDNNDFSWGDVPSQKYIEEAYAKALSFRKKVQELIDGDSDYGDKGLDAAAADSDADGSGVFSGVSGSVG